MHTHCCACTWLESARTRLCTGPTSAQAQSITLHTVLHVRHTLTLFKARNKEVVYWQGWLPLLHSTILGEGLVHIYICSYNIHSSSASCRAATTTTTSFIVTIATALDNQGFEGRQVKGWTLFSGEIKFALCLDRSSEDWCPAAEESVEWAALGGVRSCADQR